MNDKEKEEVKSEIHHVLSQLAAGHRRSAKFYHESNDRTYDQAFMALEIMHSDTAKLIEDILK